MTGDIMAGNGAAPLGDGDRGWTQRAPLNHGRGGLDAATVNRRILAIGGFDPQGPRGNNSVDFVEARLNGGDGTWHDIAPLPVPRSNAQVAVLDGLVYVTGGVGPHHAELEGVVIFN